MQVAQTFKKIKTNFRARTSAERICYVLILTLVLQVLSPYFFVKQAHAATLTEASIRLSRMSATFAATSSYPILVLVKPATTIASGSSPKVRVTWPTSSAFTVNATAANHDTNTTCVPSTFQGESVDTLTITNNEASAVSSGAVTYDVGEELTSGTLYGFCTYGGVTNPASGNAGTHVVTVDTLASSTLTDTSSVAVDVTAVNADQVALFATVSATFNFALSANQVAMGALSSSARAYGEVTADIDTNANNGWAAWIRSEGGAATLASATSGDSISSTATGSPVTATIGAKGYVVDVGVTNGTGSGTPNVTSEYDGGTDDAANGSSTAGGVLDTAYEEIANSTGPGDNDGITLEAVVTISTVTEAATDYTDTWEVVGAGNF